MRFVEVPRFGGAEVLQIMEAPDLTPQAGEIVVSVKAAGVNFADIMARQGNYPNVKAAPFRPGYEIAGVVTAVGDSVQGFSGGERVMGMLGDMGGYSSQAALPAETAIRLPDTLDFAPATALLVQGLTAYFLLEAGGLKGGQTGQTVLIPGAAGGVGSLAVQIAKLKGAGKVIGLASPAKHDLVRSLGADVALDYTQSGWSQTALAETGGKGVDIFLDSQGDPATEAFDALAEKAHWLIFGSQSGSGNALSPERIWGLVGKNATLRGYNLFGNLAEFGRGLGDLIDWATSGKLTLSAQRFPLADVARAHEAVSHRQTTGKVVLEP